MSASPTFTNEKPVARTNRDGLDFVWTTTAPSAAPVLEVSPISPDRRSRLTNGQNPRNFKFERADWTLFRSISFAAGAASEANQDDD